MCFCPMLTSYQSCLPTMSPWRKWWVAKDIMTQCGFSTDGLILFCLPKQPTFGINIKTCACVRFFLALHPDQQHPAAEGAAGEDVWSHGWKRCERLFSTRKQPKLRLFNYSDIVPNASISAMCYYYPITQPPVNPNSWVSLCVFIVAF